MSERLAELMRAETDALHIPAPPAAATYAQGRRLRRRKQLTTGVVAAALVAVIGAGTAVAVQSYDGAGKDRRSEIGPATQTAYLENPVLAVGNTVYLGDQTTVEVEDDIHSLLYTSAGLLVRTNKDGGASDGSEFGPSSPGYTLIRPDGSTKDFGVLTEDQRVSSDPTQPYLAWAEVNGEDVSVVLLDVRSGDEKRVPVPGLHDWGDWNAPLVSLSGDVVYVSNNDGVLEVDWRTGDVSPNEHLDSPFSEVNGGRYTTMEAERSVIADATTGELLLQFPAAAPVGLSPDGRFAKYGHATFGRPGSFDVYDVRSATHSSFEGDYSNYGWTPDGHLFTVDQGKVKICDAVSGECTTGYEVPGTEHSKVRLGGMTYEA
ncbi:hypothetical protein [Nocardioides speluncae]|uniref:hypothetical protein n=1 Tax=Nocardioides speluncae TaxID=2670337 RepID=UPI0012B16E37|nr:hypothetical protein [Nocardioides speluncae]